MFNDDNEIKGVCCVDCAVIDNGGDIDAHMDTWDKTRKLMWFISNNHYHIVVGEKEDDFSDKDCEICLTKLAGERYSVSMWEYPEN